MDKKTRLAIEAQMFPWIVLQPVDKGWQWGIDNKGCHGEAGFGGIELIDRGDKLTLRGRHFPTQAEAQDAAIHYIWLRRADIVEMAKKEAELGAVYRAKKRNKS